MRRGGGDMTGLSSKVGLPDGAGASRDSPAARGRENAEGEFPCAGAGSFGSACSLIGPFFPPDCRCSGIGGSFLGGSSDVSDSLSESLGGELVSFS